ncbi:MAG: hypothetical protein GXP27_06455 [Planctomycetes bacterium]|nr:hypothetical protein [Planctomycetota bacterium]
MYAKLWWLIQKDLVSEYRARCVWPPMLVLGMAVALVFSMQLELLAEQKRQLVGSLLWLATFFAGTIAIDRSFGAEREDGCWEALCLYPIAPSWVYLAKFLVNVVALAALQCVLIPLMVAFSDVPLFAHPGDLLVVVSLGNVGLAAVGTLLSGLVMSVGRSSSLLALLALPMVVPILLACSEATRLVAQDTLDTAWWRWIQLLIVFDVLFITLGMMLFGFVVEE